MAISKPGPSLQKFDLFELVILILSAYVLGALAVSTLFRLDRETERLLDNLDTVICFFFLFDFCRRFYRAENKWQYMKWGWIDLISSIPALDYFRAGRLFRLIRILRILRAFRSMRVIVSFIFSNREKGTITSVAIVAILMIIFSSIAILQFETTENGNIKTAEDAIWWSFVTITTVGYGDKFPVTTEGRLVAAGLMFCGVGLFGVFAGYIASWFVGDKEKT